MPDLPRAGTWLPLPHPQAGSFLVCLIEEVSGSRVHVMTIRGKFKVIAGHFAFDAPPVVLWTPLPPLDEELLARMMGDRSIEV